MEEETPKVKVGDLVQGPSGTNGMIVAVKEYYVLVKFDNNRYGWFSPKKLKHKKESIELTNEIKEAASEIQKTIETTSLDQKQKMETFHSLDSVFERR